MAGLREFAGQLGIEEDVFFLGRCDNVADLLFASEIGVLSSKAEGFANAILEYMAAGLPVVATDVGGAREAIAEGETGYTVASGDDELMAARVVALLNEPKRARAMGERGKLIAAEKFSCDRHLENTLELYDELLSKPKSAPSGIGREWRLNE
jgi:glycosyltransferase involved in cell wall biosynthesis